MRPIDLRPLLLTLGLGLLPACPDETPIDPSDDTTSSGDTDTTSDPTIPPTSDPTPTGTPSTDPSTTTGDTSAETTTLTDPATDTTADPTGDTESTGPDPDTDTTTGGDQTLCDRLGGFEGVQELVGGFLGVVLGDQRINGYFLNDDVDAANLLTQVSDQIGEAVGCEGVVYGGLDMATAHAGLGISTQDFTDFAEDFGVAWQQHALAHPALTMADLDTVAAALAGMAGEIVEDPGNNLTVYQRVGRKPAIVTLIGDPDALDSFVGLVAANPAINSFFAGPFDRLGTCLTRQVAGIDGPTKYGQEVDSPAPGVDEGVSAMAQCRDMLTAHEGLLDADMQPIHIEDFLTLVTDLVTAMTTAGIADDPDQQAILAALAPLCDQIVGPVDDKNACPGNKTTLTVDADALALAIPDDAYNGTLASMACHPLSVPADGLDFVDSVELTFAADSTWIGDITIKVVSPDMKILTVLSRPKTGVDYPDNGMSCCGTGTDLVKTSPLTFRNGAPNDAKLMGSALMNLDPGEWVCQDDDKCEYFPNHGTGPGTNFNDFRGDNAVGDWQVCVGDSGAKDFTIVDHVGLKFSKVKFDPS